MKNSREITFCSNTGTKLRWSETCFRILFFRWKVESNSNLGECTLDRWLEADLSLLRKIWCNGAARFRNMNVNFFTLTRPGYPRWYPRLFNLFKTRLGKYLTSTEGDWSYHCWAAVEHRIKRQLVLILLALFSFNSGSLKEEHIYVLCEIMDA